MITDIENTQIAPAEIRRRQHTIVAGELLTRSDGATVRLIEPAVAVVVVPAQPRGGV